jgi:hypothetical protein
MLDSGRVQEFAMNTSSPDQANFGWVGKWVGCFRLNSLYVIDFMVRPERFELPTFWFVARRSIQLSYGRMKSTHYEKDTQKIPSGSNPPSPTEEFIHERRYLKNLTPKTLAWYDQMFKVFNGALDSKQTINQRIVALRERGIAATSVNSWLTCINAFLRWRGEDYKIPKLQVEKKILGTFTNAAGKAATYLPRGVEILSQSETVNEVSPSYVRGQRSKGLCSTARFLNCLSFVEGLRM